MNTVRQNIQSANYPVVEEVSYTSSKAEFFIFFTISFLLLSVSGVAVFIGISVQSAIGISLILLAMLTFSYVCIFRSTLPESHGEELPDMAPHVEPQMRTIKKQDLPKDYVAMESNSAEESISRRRRKAELLRQQALLDAQRRKELERHLAGEKKEKEKIETCDEDTIREQFIEDPLSNLVETQKQIMDLLDKSQVAFDRLESVFGARLHKNTRNDISNFLLLRRLTDAFRLRLEQIVDTLDLVEKEQRLNLERGFLLAHGPLILASDSISSLSDSSTEIAPIPRDNWDSTLTTLLRQIARKKTFHQALNPEHFRF
jgi:hypothetical protein